MAAVKSQEDQFSWLDNSFTSVSMKAVDISHSTKRSRCSAVSHGKRKMAKLLCSTQKDNINNSSTDPCQQVLDITCNKRVFTDGKRIITSSDADENKLKAVSRPYPSNDALIGSAADGSDNIRSFSKQDHSMTSVFIICCSFYY